METMFEAQTMDFPFVEELPKRERSKIATLWDRFHELRAITEEKGMLLPIPFCAALLGISRQRVDQLTRDGRLERVELDQAVFVTEKSLKRAWLLHAKWRRQNKACPTATISLSSVYVPGFFVGPDGRGGRARRASGGASPSLSI
jgi:hypothetical protein